MEGVGEARRLGSLAQFAKSDGCLGVRPGWMAGQTKESRNRNSVQRRELVDRIFGGNFLVELAHKAALPERGLRARS